MPTIDPSLSSRGFAGIKGDLSRRLTLWGSDWRDGLHRKVPAATVFLFFACLAPAIAFGGLMSVATDGAIGVFEMTIATAVCGVVYAIAAGQPLTILGGTGPLLVFTTMLYSVCREFELPFLAVYGWIGLWAALMLIIAAVTGVSRVIGLFTRFTDETFAALISAIFIVQAIQSVIKPFPEGQVADDSALLGLLLALGTYLVASTLARLRHSTYLRGWVREALADFGPAIAVVLMVLVRRLMPDVQLVSLDIPDTFATTTGRPWLAPLFDVPVWVMVGAAIPAALVALLVLLDQQITVRIVQSPENRLVKGSAYHWDLGLVGVLLGACSLFGVPWLVAATVRSLNHVKALARGDTDPPAKGGVVENRLSPLFIHALVGAALLAATLLRQVPLSVLYGLFLYMGVASTRGSQLVERMRLFVTDPAKLPEHHYVRRVPARVIHAFTAVQTASLVLLWIVKSSAVGILFPLFIALLVPLRALLGRFFAPEHLAALDAEETLDEAEDELG